MTVDKASLLLIGLSCLQGAPGAPPAAAAPAAPPKDENKPETNDAEDDSKFDHFMGNDAGALAGTFGEYDQDDREADEVYFSPRPYLIPQSQDFGWEHIPELYLQLNVSQDCHSAYCRSSAVLAVC